MEHEKTLHTTELPVEFEGKSMLIRLREGVRDLTSLPSSNDYEFFLRSGNGDLHRISGAILNLKIEFCGNALPIMTATFLDKPIFDVPLPTLSIDV